MTPAETTAKARAVRDWLKEFRDPFVWNLLCKAKGIWHIEIKDRKDRTIKYT